MFRILLPSALLVLALSLFRPYFWEVVHLCKYAYTGWDYLRQLGWKANAWKALAWNSRDDIGRAYAVANYYNTMYEINSVKSNTSWWEVDKDYETLFNKERV